MDKLFSFMKIMTLMNGILSYFLWLTETWKVHYPLENLTVSLQAATSIENPQDERKGFGEEKPLHLKISKYIGPSVVDQVFWGLSFKSAWLCCVQDTRSQGKVRFLSHDTKAVQTFPLDSWKWIYFIWGINTVGVNTCTTRKEILSSPRSSQVPGMSNRKRLFPPMSCLDWFIETLQWRFSGKPSRRMSAEQHTFQWEDRQH